VPQGTKRLWRHLLETGLERGSPRPAPKQEACAGHRGGPDHHGRDLAVADGARRGTMLEHLEVLVHPLACLLYLLFDLTRRSAHSLFSFRLSRVRGGTWNRSLARPNMISSTASTT